MTLQVDVVIGADGANSRVAKEIDAGKYDYAIAFQERIRIPDEKMDYYKDFAEMYVGDDVSPDFYGWVFPKYDHVAVGTGTVVNKTAIKQYQQATRDRSKVSLVYTDCLTGWEYMAVANCYWQLKDILKSSSLKAALPCLQLQLSCSVASLQISKSSLYCFHLHDQQCRSTPNVIITVNNCCNAVVRHLDLCTPSSPALRECVESTHASSNA